jgi:hypothetical protein
METYNSTQVLSVGLICLIIGAVVTFLALRKRPVQSDVGDEASHEDLRQQIQAIREDDGPYSGSYHGDANVDPNFFPEITDEATLQVNEEQRIEDEREKVTLEKHIKSLMRAGYVMVDGIPRRYLFCLEEGEKTPFGNMYYRNEEPEECLSIEIRDQRRITQPPEWYDLISDCYKLVDGVKSLRYALMLSMGVEQDTIERPLRLVFYDNGYMPVIKVYTDMSWFDDQRWGGPVIIVGHNGQAMGIVPAMKPYDVHLLMEEVVAKALPFMDAMPSDYDGHMQLSQGIAELHAAIKEAGCHAKEVEEA